MNCTKFSLPSQAFLDFYYHFSNLMVFLSLLITPLQLYIILTKSQTLKSFKWLILNHLFWALLFEITFALIIKPIFLLPALGIYPIGVIREGSYLLMQYVIVIGTLFLGMYIASLFATLVNRYLLTFHTKLPKYLQQKYVITLYTLILIFITGIVISGPIKAHINDPSYYLQAAIDYDPCMKDIISQEPGLIYSLHGDVEDFIGISVGIIEIFIILGCISIVAVFTYFVKSQKSQTLEKLQRSLIISAVAQLSITVIFLIIPLTLLTLISSFQNYHFPNVLIIILCMIFSHSFFESLSTLYFVAPYRKGVAEVLGKYFSCFKNANLRKSVVVITPTVTETSSVNFSRIQIRHS